MFRRPFLCSPSGFTLMELFVCVAVMALLAALLIPAVSRLTRRAQTTECLSNQKQILTGLLLHAADHDGQLPHYQVFEPDGTRDRSSYWWLTTRPYWNLPSGASALKYFRCPAAPQSVTTTVGVNYSEVPDKAPFAIKGGGMPGSMKLARVRGSTILTADIECPAGHWWFLSPNQFPLNTDTDGDGIPDSRPGNPSSNWFSPRHAGSAVCGFADGSVRIVPLVDWAKNAGNMWGP